VIAPDRPNGCYYYAATTTVYEDAMEVFYHLVEAGA
jgi:hypothetical protein